MSTFYLNPQNARKDVAQLRISLSYFLKNSTKELFITGTVAIGFLIGFGVFGVVAIEFAEFEYDFSHYGRETTATVVDCKMVAGRGDKIPLITYSYVVNNKTYSNTWLAQFVYPDCESVPNPSTLDVIYLENDPASSIEGKMTKFSGGNIAVYLFSAGALGFAIQFVSFMRHLVDIRAIWLWRNQASRLKVLPGKIVAVKPMVERRKNEVQVLYRYQSPVGNGLVEAVTFYRPKDPYGSLPEAGMGVVVLYFDSHIVTIA